MTAPRSALLRRLVLTASGVLANFGGVPLAFAFIATIGNAGVVTAMLKDPSASSWTTPASRSTASAGLALVYLYFLIPLMVLVIVPALDGLRPQWSEAAQNLGATPLAVLAATSAVPVLAPPVLGAMMLLFCGAFAAFATAAAMVGSTVPLVTLQIADVLSGNVLAGQENVGKALGLGHGRGDRGLYDVLLAAAAAYLAVAAVTASPAWSGRPRDALPARRRLAVWRGWCSPCSALYFVVPMAASFWFTVGDRAPGLHRSSTTPASSARRASLDAFGLSLQLALLTSWSRSG